VGRDQLFDLPFRLATSLAHDSLVVLLRQVMRQQEQASEMMAPERSSSSTCGNLFARRVTRTRLPADHLKLEMMVS
jgi:hypothetical protein